MKRHTKIYLDYFGYTVADFIPCEACGSKAIDIHHIDSRGMGGSKNKDFIENLAALCRSCHMKAETNKDFNDLVKIKHINKLPNKHLL